MKVWKNKQNPKTVACKREADSLTGRSLSRAKAYKFTLHEALIAELCGSNVEFLIYSL